MSRYTRIAIVLLVVAAAVAAVVAKHWGTEPASLQASASPAAPVDTAKSAPPQNSTEAVKPAALPKLIDLGARKCIPCKAMAPILEGLKQEYAGKFDVEFIDVWDNPEKAEEHGVEIIPTQIFFDATGKELFRHEGFFSKEDILATWTQAGVEFAG